MTELPIVSDPAEVTPDWLTRAFHASGRANGARVAAIRAREYVGTGQSARNVRFALEWDGPADGAPDSVIGKFPSDDPTSRATGAQHGSYLKEVEFYRQVAGTVDIRTPACWHAAIAPNATDFVLLMEDLAGSVQGDQVAGCDVAQAALALGQAARLHAPRWGDPTLAELPFLGAPSPESAALLQGIYLAVWPGFEARYASRLEEGVVALAERFGPRVGAWSQTLPSPLTVTHGDFRLDNMLFGRAEGAPPLVVVDWQTVSRGVGAADVAYFLGAGLVVEERRAHERALVREYWQELCARGVADFSFDECWRDYRHTTFGGVLMAVVASQIVEQTDRGDDMFVAMASRHGQHALDLEAEKLLGEEF